MGQLALKLADNLVSVTAKMIIDFPPLTYLMIC